MMDTLQTFPSIVMWVPYNEGWSQPGAFPTHAALDWTKAHDPTRLVNGPSGWVDFEGGDWGHQPERRAWTRNLPPGVCEAADVIDRHDYNRVPGMAPLNASRSSASSAASAAGSRGTSGRRRRGAMARRAAPTLRRTGRRRSRRGMSR